MLQRQRTTTKVPRTETDDQGQRTVVVAITVTETWEERYDLASIRAQIGGTRLEQSGAERQAAHCAERCRELEAMEALLGGVP